MNKKTIFILCLLSCVSYSQASTKKVVKVIGYPGMGGDDQSAQAKVIRRFSALVNTGAETSYAWEKARSLSPTNQQDQKKLKKERRASVIAARALTN